MSNLSSALSTFRDNINQADTPKDIRYDNGEKAEITFSIVDDAIKANTNLMTVENAAEEEVLKQLPGIGHIRKIYNGILNNEYSWEIMGDTEYSQIRKITQLKDLTLKQEPKNSSWLLITSKFYQKYFPLDLIKTILSFPYYLFGKPAYDKALRLQCDLIQILLVFHLKSDFRFNLLIDAEKLTINEPFSRIQTRKINRRCAMKNKYFNEEFDLKQVILTMFTNFFPNVSWRYIGGEHVAHRLILQTMEFVFQLGLWKASDVDEITKILLEKSENLNTLE